MQKSSGSRPGARRTAWLLNTGTREPSLRNRSNSPAGGISSPAAARSVHARTMSRISGGMISSTRSRPMASSAV